MSRIHVIAAVLVLFGALSADGSPFDRLPDHLVYRIAGTDCETVARCAQVDRRFRRIFTLPPIVHALFFGPVADDDDDLCDGIRKLSSAVDRDRQWARLLTPQLGAGLYDRLVRHPGLTTTAKALLLGVLARDVSADAFADVIRAPCTANSAIFTELLLSQGRSAADIAGIPAELLQTIEEYLQMRPPSNNHGLRDDQQRELQERYPPPFNQLVPDTTDLAHWLLRRYPPRNHPLADPHVVRALLRCGLRFSLFLFMKHVEIATRHVTATLPLLYVPDGYSMFILMHMLVRTGRTGHVRALFQVAAFRQLVRTQPHQFMYYVMLSIPRPGQDWDARPFFQFLVGVSFITDLINVTDWAADHVLKVSVERRQWDIARVLLQVPSIDIFKRPGGVFDFVFDPDRSGFRTRIRWYGDFLHSAEIADRVRSDSERFLAFLRPLLEKNQLDMIEYLMSSKFYSTIVAEGRDGLHQYIESPEMQNILFKIDTAWNPCRNKIPEYTEFVNRAGNKP